MPNKLTIRSQHRIEYSALKHAIDRCTNPNHVYYYNYGGRGITVDPLFTSGTMGFYHFLEEVGLRPGPEYSLDRIDNDLGYQPGNLRWATREQQQHNRRPGQRPQRDYGHGFGTYEVNTIDGKKTTKRSPLIQHPDGRIKTLNAWADELGLAKSTLRQRLQKNWPLDLALTSELYMPNDKITKGAGQRVADVIDLLDASINSISRRTH